jgi:hypothetical protein
MFSSRRFILFLSGFFVEHTLPGLFLCISFFALIICRLPQRCINSTSTPVKKSRYHLFKEITPFSVFLDGEGFILYF